MSAPTYIFLTILLLSPQAVLGVPEAAAGTASAVVGIAYVVGTGMGHHVIWFPV
jgi:hypothetical protein